MSRVSIATMSEAPVVSLPDGLAGSGEARALFHRDKDPIHVLLHKVRQGEDLRIGPMANDSVAYVWAGGVEADGEALSHGSSLIVERSASVEIVGVEADSLVLTFAASKAPAHDRAGGHVHLLPDDQVPRLADLGGGSGVGGGMHADASCPTCEVWLHENVFPGSREPLSAEHAEKGIHAHSEDEVIFVTAGQMRLGARLYGAGTALAIAADTMYSFTPGPDGLSFINFRAARPSEIHFRSGAVMDEIDYWKTRLPSPHYISLG